MPELVYLEHIVRVFLLYNGSSGHFVLVCCWEKFEAFVVVVDFSLEFLVVGEEE